ncbi:MAG TPA: NYN domain-containing protein [Anaerolineales bacterium]|nr:NYN domain-containing protein [Anaerolineales bacterium]
MAYLIDGHNLLGILSDITLQSADKEEKLVQKLRPYFAYLRQNAHVFFDGGVVGSRAQLKLGNIQVFFARQGSSADALIAQRIRTHPNPSELVLVSNDRQLLQIARNNRARWMTASQFAQELSNYKPQKQANPTKLSSEEVTEWLTLFGQGDTSDS